MDAAGGLICLAKNVCAGLFCRSHGRAWFFLDMKVPKARLTCESVVAQAIVCTGVTECCLSFHGR